MFTGGSGGSDASFFAKSITDLMVSPAKLSLMLCQKICHASSVRRAQNRLGLCILDVEFDPAGPCFENSSVLLESFVDSFHATTGDNVNSGDELDALHPFRVQVTEAGPLKESNIRPSGQRYDVVACDLIPFSLDLQTTIGHGEDTSALHPMLVFSAVVDVPVPSTSLRILFASILLV